MKEISIQDLKRQLSAVLAEAGRGASVLVTRHGKPLARISPVVSPSLHVGESFGRGRVRPAVRHSSKGRYLEVLADDRRGAGARE